MAVSRSDRNRSDKDAITEKVFWDEIDALKKQIRLISPGTTAAPTIVGQPQNQVGYVDGIAVFAVAVIATIPVQYQWRKGGVDIADEVGATLVLRNLTTADAGEYSVVVRSGVGATESERATLTVQNTGLGVPIGGIIGYQGAFADIPSNFALCDGTGGTPDMRDRFVLGTATEADVGTTGGTHQHYHQKGTLVDTATSAGTPAVDAHTTRADVPAGGANTVLTGPAAHTGTPLPNHQHTLTGRTAAPENGAGSTAMLDVLPPWFKLAYIKRIS